MTSRKLSPLGSFLLALGAIAFTPSLLLAQSAGTGVSDRDRYRLIGRRDTQCNGNAHQCGHQPDPNHRDWWKRRL